MQYSKISKLIDEQTLLEWSLKYNKSVEELGKWLIKQKIPSQLWARAHVERGILRNIELVTKDNIRYQVVVEIENSKQGIQKNFKETRSIFFTDFEKKKFNQWSQYLNKKCLFYVSYTEKESDDSVYRTLLDIESV